jgi:hypothetical protein
LNGATVLLGTTTGTTYTDTTAVVNTVYSYQVTNGTNKTNSFRAAMSDMTLPFNCPPMQQVPASMLGVDRTESFQSANGTTYTFTIKAPVPGTFVQNVAPCNGAGGCSDYDNITNALAAIKTNGAGTLILGAGDFHLTSSSWVSGNFQGNILVESDDVVLSGSGFDSNGIPLTHVYFGQTPSTIGNVQGLVLGGNRNLARNLVLDWDFPTGIPGTVNNVVDATFTGTIVASGPPNAGSGVLTVSSVASGTLAVNQNIFDIAGAIGSLAQIVSLGTGTGGTGTYNLQYGLNPSTNVPSPIAMTAVSKQRFNIQNGPYYVPNPTNPPSVVILDGYNLTKRTYDLRNGSRNGLAPPVFNPNFSVDGLYYYEINQGNFLPDGEQGVAFVKTGEGIQIGAVSSDASLENVALYGGGGIGLTVASYSTNVRLSNFTISRKPDSILRSGEPVHYVSLIGDSDSCCNFGNILIENSEMGYQDDDDFWLRGNSFQLQSTDTLSTTGFVFTTTYPISTNFGLDHLQISFLEPANYKVLGTVTPTSWSTVNNADGSYTYTVSYPVVPELAPYIGKASADLPVMVFPKWSSSIYIIRNSCFHDNHGRILSYAQNGLIENNTFGNNYYGPIEMSSYLTAPVFTNTAGPNPGNITIRSNNIVGMSYGDFATVWSPLSVTTGAAQTGGYAAGIDITGSGNTGFTPTGNPFKNIEISDNLITNTVGLCITVIGGDNVGVVNNHCVNNNTIPYIAGFDAAHCKSPNESPLMPYGAGQPYCTAKAAAQQSIFISNTNNVDTTSTPNQFLGTTIPGVFLNPGTIQQTKIVGSRFR